MRKIFVRAKAVSRCACHRSPRRAFQLQRSCVIQPSVGAQRLRWVNGQNENNSEGVVAGLRQNGGRAQAPTPSALMNWWGRFPKVGAPRRSGSDRQPWADGFESRWDSRSGCAVEASNTCGINVECPHCPPMPKLHFPKLKWEIDPQHKVPMRKRSVVS